MLAWIMLRYDGWLVHAKLNCDVFMTLTNDITPVDGMKYMIYSYSHTNCVYNFLFICHVTISGRTCRKQVEEEVPSVVAQVEPVVELPGLGQGWCQLNAKHGNPTGFIIK